MIQCMGSLHNKQFVPGGGGPLGAVVGLAIVIPRPIQPPNAVAYLESMERRGLDLPDRDRLKDWENAFLRALVTLPLW